MSYVLKIYKQQIKKFNYHMKQYCKENNLEYDFNTFLNHNWKGFCSPAWTYLSFLPQIYLANSYAFMAYFEKLDKDFRDDLITSQELKQAQMNIQTNKKYRIYLKKIMKDDAIF